MLLKWTRPTRARRYAPLRPGLPYRPLRRGRRDNKAIVSASVKEDHTSATSPAAKPPRGGQSSGNETLPAPTSTNDRAKVMCKKLIRSEDSCTHEVRREDMVTASLRRGRGFEPSTQFAEVVEATE